MGRYLKFVLTAALMICAVVIGPPDGDVPTPNGNPIPNPGQPPVIVVIPGSK